MAGAIGNERDVPERARRVEDFHAQQPLVQLRAQALVAGHGRVPGEVIERVMDGAGPQVGVQQAIEVGQHLRALGAELVVELAATAQLHDVQQDAPASEEAARIENGVLVAAVGQLIQPGLPQREEVAQGLREQGTDLLVGCQGRPCRRRRCRTCVRISAVLS